MTLTASIYESSALNRTLIKLWNAFTCIPENSSTHHIRFKIATGIAVLYWCISMCICSYFRHLLRDYPCTIPCFSVETCEVGITYPQFWLFLCMYLRTLTKTASQHVNTCAYFLHILWTLMYSCQVGRTWTYRRRQSTPNASWNT